MMKDRENPLKRQHCCSPVKELRPSYTTASNLKTTGAGQTERTTCHKSPIRKLFSRFGKGKRQEHKTNATAFQSELDKSTTASSSHNIQQSPAVDETLLYDGGLVEYSKEPKVIAPHSAKKSSNAAGWKGDSKMLQQEPTTIHYHLNIQNCDGVEIHVDGSKGIWKGIQDGSLTSACSATGKQLKRLSWIEDHSGTPNPERGPTTEASLCKEIIDNPVKITYFHSEFVTAKGQGVKPYKAAGSASPEDSHDHINIKQFSKPGNDGMQGMRQRKRRRRNTRQSENGAMDIGLSVKSDKDFDADLIRHTKQLGIKCSHKPQGHNFDQEASSKSSKETVHSEVRPNESQHNRQTPPFMSKYESLASERQQTSLYESFKCRPKTFAQITPKENIDASVNRVDKKEIQLENMPLCLRLQTGLVSRRRENFEKLTGSSQKTGSRVDCNVPSKCPGKFSEVTCLKASQVSEIDQRHDPLHGASFVDMESISHNPSDEFTSNITSVVSIARNHTSLENVGGKMSKDQQVHKPENSNTSPKISVPSEIILTPDKTQVSAKTSDDMQIQDLGVSLTHVRCKTPARGLNSRDFKLSDVDQHQKDIELQGGVSDFEISKTQNVFTCDRDGPKPDLINSEVENNTSLAKSAGLPIFANSTGVASSSDDSEPQFGLQCSYNQTERSTRSNHAALLPVSHKEVESNAERNVFDIGHRTASSASPKPPVSLSESPEKTSSELVEATTSGQLRMQNIRQDELAGNLLLEERGQFLTSVTLPAMENTTDQSAQSSSGTQEPTEQNTPVSLGDSCTFKEPTKCKPVGRVMPSPRHRCNVHMAQQIYSLEHTLPITAEESVEDKLTRIRPELIRIPGVLIVGLQEGVIRVTLSPDRRNIDDIVIFMHQRGVAVFEYECGILSRRYRHTVASEFPPTELVTLMVQ